MDRSRTKRGRVVAVVGWALIVAGIVAPRVAGQQPAPAAREEPGDLKLANRLLNERLYAPAAEEYERVMKSARPGSPELIEATFGLANSTLFLNRLPEARKHFQDFLRVAPKHQGAATAWFRVGETAYLLGDLKPAREALEIYTTRYPDGKHMETAWPHLGDVCLRLGDRDAAQKAYRQGLAQFPDGRLADRARCGLARTLAASGQADQALELLQPLADAPGKPFADQARFLIGQIHGAANRFDLAAAAYERLERDAPRSALLGDARLARAAALNKIDRRDEADEILRKLIAESPRNLAAQAALDLAASQLDRGRAADARATCEDAVKRFEGAPSVPPLMFRSAEAAAKNGQIADARAGFLKMAALFPADAWADDALLQVATLALKAQDNDGAREAVAGLLERYPQSIWRPNALLIDARASYEAGRPKDAIRTLESLLGDGKAGPEVAADARYYLGLAYRKDGQKERAAKVLDELARTPAAPGAVGVQFLVGQSHIEAGRYAEAIEPLEKYLATQPDGEVADVALSYLAQARLEGDQPEAARAALAQLEQRFPKSKELPRTWLRLGEEALKRQQYAEAARLLRQVVDGDEPTWKARALSGLGWAQFQQGQPADAAASFARLLKLAPDDALAPEAAFLRGQALEAAGQKEDALLAYLEVVESYPKEKPAASAALARARLLAEDRPDAAAEAFDLYLKQYTRPGEPGTDAILAEWGAVLLDAGKTAEADAVFRRLVDTFPISAHAAEARLNLAVSASEAKDDAGLDRYLGPLTAEGAKGDPEVLQKALFLRGRTLAERQDWWAAQATFERLVREYPDSPNRAQALFWRGEVAYRAGNPKAADAAFADLIQAADPAGANEWVKTARLRRLQCLVQLEKWDEAIAAGDAFRRELADDDRLIAEVEYQRGRALQTIAPPRFAEARAAYDAVLAARPADDLAARAQFMKGETYFFEKDHTNARREYLKVATFYDAPRWQSAALLQTGKVYERLDQWAEAAEIYEKLRSKFADAPDAAESVAEAVRRLEVARRRAGTANAQSGDADPGVTKTSGEDR